MQKSSLRTSEAVHEIIQRYSDMVYRIAYARTGNRADAEDVYQEVFFTSLPDSLHLTARST